MAREDVGSGRDTNLGADTADGRTGDVGASVTGGDAADVQTGGDAKAARTGDNPVSGEEARQADESNSPSEGTPEDLQPGKRRTVGLDEDSGAGRPDMSGTPDSTTGG